MAIVLITSNQRLIVRIRESRAELNDLRRAYTEPSFGVPLPPITGRNLNGESVSISYGAGENGTLILIAAVACPFARSNWKAWETLIKSIPVGGHRIVFVDLPRNPDRDFFSPHGILPARILRVDAEAKLAYRIGLTPQTLLIGPDGRLRGVWSGVLLEESLNEISRLASAAGVAGHY